LATADDRHNPQSIAHRIDHQIDHRNADQIGLAIEMLSKRAIEPRIA
jgi:hypothetical protein